MWPCIAGGQSCRGRFLYPSPLTAAPKFLKSNPHRFSSASRTSSTSPTTATLPRKRPTLPLGKHSYGGTGPALQSILSQPESHACHPFPPPPSETTRRTTRGEYASRLGSSPSFLEARRAPSVLIGALSDAHAWLDVVYKNHYMPTEPAVKMPSRGCAGAKTHAASIEGESRMCEKRANALFVSYFPRQPHNIAPSPLPHPLKTCSTTAHAP